MIDDTIRKALEWCIYRRIPFCMWREPEGAPLRFYSAPSLLTSSLGVVPDEGFFISPYDVRFSKNLWIPFELDAAATLSHRMKMPENRYTDPELTHASTEIDEYIRSINGVIKELNDNQGGKTVLSVVHADYRPSSMASDNILSVFECGGQYFCSAYYHPLTGFWMGATPEMLLKVDLRNGKYRTMALAATTDHNADVWEVKELREQSYVRFFVKKALLSRGANITNEKDHDICYGRLVHRCTEFSGTLNGADPYELIDDLNPTPALCGFPREMARQSINAHEKHQRRCYGGYIGVRTPKYLTAYVNIRCAQFDKSWYNFYTGGGILENSDPEREWQETMAKREAFIDMMKH